MKELINELKSIDYNEYKVEIDFHRLHWYNQNNADDEKIGNFKFKMK